MTASEHTGKNPSVVQPGPPPPPAPLGPPQVDMMASREMQEWIARLEVEQETLGVRNKYLTVALAAGVLLLAISTSSSMWNPTSFLSARGMILSGLYPYRLP